MRQRGFTVLELATSALLIALIMGTVAIAIHGDARTHRALVAPISPLMRGQKALERITAELRMASEWGEDRDKDGVLDASEDTNGNGVLDADWNLPDGVANQPTLSFNRRIDLKDRYGTTLSTGIHSRRIAYRLEGSDLVREWTVTLPTGVSKTRRTVLARRVKALRFSRAGALVSVSLDVEMDEEFSRTGRHTMATRVWLRN